MNMRLTLPRSTFFNRYAEGRLVPSLPTPLRFCLQIRASLHLEPLSNETEPYFWLIRGLYRALYDQSHFEKSDGATSRTEIFTREIVMSRRWMRLVLCMAAVSPFALLRPAIAQTTGSVLGTVTDSSGAGVPGAKITALSKQQGLTRTTTSNASGSYMLPALPLGTYTVTIEASGFEGFSNTAVTVDADQSVRVDAALR